MVKLYLDQYRMTHIAKTMDLNIQTVSQIVKKYVKDGEININLNNKGSAHNNILTG